MACVLTDRHTDKQTDRLDRHTHRQTDRQTDTHTDRQTDRQTHRHQHGVCTDWTFTDAGIVFEFTEKLQLAGGTVKLVLMQLTCNDALTNTQHSQPPPSSAVSHQSTLTSHRQTATGRTTAPTNTPAKPAVESLAETNGRPTASHSRTSFYVDSSEST